MGLSEAREAKYRITAETATEGGLSFAEIARHAHHLPATLLDLMARSDSLYKRIHRLDRSLYATLAAHSGNTVAGHLARLSAAFDR